MLDLNLDSESQRIIVSGNEFQTPRPTQFLLGGPRRRRNTAMMFGMVKLEWCGYTRRLKKFEDMFIRFDRIHEQTDRQSDRQTPHDGIGRACIASRGKTV